MKPGLVSALESGLVRGESLKRAMMTLFNAGYLKEDIEEAAAAVQKIPIQKTIVEQKLMQPVSVYEKSKNKINIILIIILLVILFGSIIAIFLFKEEMMRFFNNLIN